MPVVGPASPREYRYCEGSSYLHLFYSLSYQKSNNVIDTIWAMTYNMPGLLRTNLQLRGIDGNMKVNVKSFAHLRLALGKTPVTIEIPDGSTVADLIDTIVAQYGDAARDAIWKRVGEELKITPVNDGKSIPLDAPLQDGMTVVFLSVVAAG